MLGGQDGTVPSAVSGDDMHPFRRPPLRAIKTASTIGFTICAAAARSNSLASGQAFDRCPSRGRGPPAGRLGALAQPSPLEARPAPRPVPVPESRSTGASLRLARPLAAGARFGLRARRRVQPFPGTGQADAVATR